jgi:RNA polymerase sigma factor for flagellar operon FliA
MSAAVKEKQSAEVLDELMTRYRQTRDIALRNELVMHYSYIAKVVGVQMRGITANYAQLEDIVHQGIIALIDCVERFDPTKGIGFKTYAFMRVQGAVIDFVRKQDWFPRRIRVNAKAVFAAHDDLCNKLLREPTQAELAKHLGMPLQTLQKNYSEINNSVLLSFEGILQNIAQSDELMGRHGNEDDMPETNLFKNELSDTLKQAIEELSERERLVVTLYYYENMKLSGIAKVLNVTDQRVSQINTKAVMKLRSKMMQYVKG